MIRTKLPVIHKTLDEETKQLVVKESTIDVCIDTSLYAEQRWETHFPHNARSEMLFAYVERIQNSGKVADRAHILSNIKAIYCFMEGEEIADFKSFLQLFDLADGDYVNRLIEKIKFVFEIALSTSTVSPKN
jgi:hypothetical protein